MQSAPDNTNFYIFFGLVILLLCVIAFAVIANKVRKIRSLDEKLKLIARQLAEKNNQNDFSYESILEEKINTEKYVQQLEIQIETLKDREREIIQENTHSMAEISKLKNEISRQESEFEQLKNEEKNNYQRNVYANYEISRLTEEINQQKIDIESNAKVAETQLANLIKEKEISDQRNRMLEERLNGIVDVELELKKIKEELLKFEILKEKINTEYEAGRHTYEKLKMEIALLEETIEIYSFGLYKPHFEFDAPEKYKAALDECINECRQLIKSNEAILCSTEWTINGSTVEGRKMTKYYSKIMLRAFNGECDAVILKVKWNNIINMEERLKNAFDSINKLGDVHQISIQKKYFDIRIKELRLAFEYQESIRDKKEEQRRIREQIREEEKSLREIATARLEAEKEETRYQKALDQAREEIKEKHGIEYEKLKEQIVSLENNLLKASELKERAISMAQITKAGHVYVISNIGSFGENKFKIGMTRRMEPSDRVRELGGASVPFGFDIHAMIYSENAPELENNFHKKFRFKRMNLVNARKEFFDVSLDEIESFAHENNYKIEFTKIAEARDFRETSALRELKDDGAIEKELEKRFPKTLFADDSEECDEIQLAEL